MVEKSIPYAGDLRACLKSRENSAEYLKAVSEENDPDALRLAIRDVAEAREGMALAAIPAILVSEPHQVPDKISLCCNLEVITVV